MSPNVVKLSLLLSLALTSAAACADILYVPIDPGTAGSGQAGVAIKPDNPIPADGILLGPTETRHDFRYYTKELSGKLNISFLDLSGSKNKSLIVAECSRGRTFEGELSNNGKTYAVKVLVGSACRLSMVVEGATLDAAVTSGSVGIGFKFKAIEETLSFLALGFTTYEPFELTVNSSGQIDLGSVRVSLINTFNKFNEKQADLSASRPLVLGYYIDREYAKEIDPSKATSLRVNN